LPFFNLFYGVVSAFGVLVSVDVDALQYFDVVVSKREVPDKASGSERWFVVWYVQQDDLVNERDVVAYNG
jgi:hypothetical protein